MSAKEINYTLQKLADAVTRLNEGIAQASSDLNKDGVIQRFEFTFELMWKSLKIILGDKGVDCKTPKDCLKAAFRIGLIEDEEAFLDMLEDRNKTSHIYDQEEASAIYQRIKDTHAKNIKLLLTRLQENKS
jgi:nucleotidyltransferase substrate binding protein (TIGR01987 family)